MTTAGKIIKLHQTAGFSLRPAYSLSLCAKLISKTLSRFIWGHWEEAGAGESVTVIALYGLGVKEAFAINLVRVILSGFTFGNMASILFGLEGAFLSLLLMVTCKYFRLFDMVGISILGVMAHNIGQFLIAAFVTKTFWRIFTSQCC